MFLLSLTHFDWPQKGASDQVSWFPKTCKEFHYFMYCKLKSFKGPVKIMIFIRIAAIFNTELNQLRTGAFLQHLWYSQMTIHLQRSSSQYVVNQMLPKTCNQDHHPYHTGLTVWLLGGYCPLLVTAFLIFKNANSLKITLHLVEAKQLSLKSEE